MFWHKKKTGAEQPEEGKKPVSKKRHFFRKFFAFLGFFLLLAMAAAGIAIYWGTQTDGGRAWIMETANKALELPAGQEGMGFKITKLSGSLPFDFHLGIDAFDAGGVWLSAPDNSFTLNWREIPGKVHISALKLNNVDLQRLPVLPPDTSPPPPPAKPFELADLQKILAQAADFLGKEHWWMPEILVENVALENALLPAGIIPQKAVPDARTCLNAGLNLLFINNKISASANADLKNANGRPVSVSSFDFDQAGISLKLDASPAPSGLQANMSLGANVASPKVEMDGFPAGYLGNDIKLALDLAASANTSAAAPAASISLTGPQLKAGHIKTAGKFQWENGPGWAKGSFDGPASLDLNLNINPVGADFIKTAPDSPFAILRAPAELKISIAGSLPVLDAVLALDCEDLASSGHRVENVKFTAKIPLLDLPLEPAGLSALNKEHHCDINLRASVDKEPVSLDTMAFFQAVPVAGNTPKEEAADNAVWRAGVRNLRLAALGLDASGDLSALLPPGEKPAVNGSLRIAVENWEGIEKFVPGQKFSGNVKVDLDFKNAAATPPATGHKLALPVKSYNIQNAHLNVEIPEFAMSPEKEGSAVRAQGINANVALTDVFAALGIAAKVDAASIEAAGMRLGAKIRADGALAGPLNAEVESSGDIRAKIIASWSPGEAVLKTCDVGMTLPANLAPSGKAVPLGIRSTSPATIHYGDKGMAVDNLDIRIQPSGQLRAHGSLAPEKLSFNLNLDNLDFKPWQIIAPQIPSGTASLTASLSGTPKKPGGNFNLSLKNVSLPNSPVQPFGLTLKGNVVNSGSASALNASLALDPKTLKTLGGSQANVTASLPLKFGPDGVPAPNMEGNVAAKILWDGALGPIWNLLPIPDRRLNGRVSVNVDASGPLRAPGIRGGVNINKARYEDLLLGVLITDINVALAFSEKGPPGKSAQKGVFAALPGGMTLTVSASDGRGGTINVNGGGALDGKDLDIKAKINHLRPLRRRDVHIELSGNASVTGSATAPVVDGEIIVNQGEVLLNNIAISGSVTTLDISDGKKTEKVETKKAKAGEQAAAPQAQGSLNVRINMLPRFVVEGRGLNSIWEAHLLVSGAPADPRITGNISAVRGNFDFLGKNFALSKGVVFFGGGSISNPLLDMELTNETPDLIAHILVTGPVNKIKLTMSSDPELPRDEILSRVLFGRSVGDLSRLEALQLAAAVAQLAGFGGGSGILGFAKKSLGVDVLRLGTTSSDAAGDPGDQTASGTTIEMGKYINDMIYMGVQQGMKADSTAFIIQLELTPRTNLEIRTEQNNTWGGLRWKYNY